MIFILDELFNLNEVVSNWHNRLVLESDIEHRQHVTNLLLGKAFQNQSSGLHMDMNTILTEARNLNDREWKTFEHYLAYDILLLTFK